MASFLSDFASAALADVIGGGVLALLVYLLIERRLKLREERERRRDVAGAVLRTVRDELTHNAQVADALLEHLPRGALPYSRFETSGWGLVSQVGGLATISAATVKLLLDTYIRTRSANEQHALLFDISYGATGAISFLIASSAPGEEGRRGFGRLEERREDVRARLLRAVEELRPRLREALDGVEGELRLQRDGGG